MNPILEQLSLVGIIPVIKLNDPEKAVPLVRALKRGGIPVAEVTFRAAGADKAIANIAREMPDILVGAGTVVTLDQCKAAIAAGAKYIISPGFDPEIVGYCVENNIPITPGCTNPSEVSVATKMGLEVVKFFPAEAMGGLKVLKALSGPFPKMRFIPTGGIGPSNLNEYLAFNKIIACGGSWMVPEKMVDNGDFDGITNLAREAVLTMLDIKVKHLGINSANQEEANKTTDTLCQIMGKTPDERTKSIFAGNDFEVMKFMGVGKCGHIGLSTTSVPRAIRYFESQGFEFDKDSFLFDDKGNVTFAYFKDEIGGFGVHLV